MLYKRPVLIILKQTMNFFKYIKNRVVQIIVSSHCIFQVSYKLPIKSEKNAIQLHLTDPYSSLSKPLLP